MDDGPPVEGEFLSESSVDADDPRNNQYTGAFFPGAQNFVIAGGKFKSITKITHVTPPVPSDFRTIPMGDLDLRHELRLASGSGVVNRWQGRRSVRRVYSARIPGLKANMTVAVYQGENAEEEWLEDISRNSWVRHPNFVQLYATASSSGVHATIFHDDLVPARQILAEYNGSHFSTMYLYHYFDTEFEDIRQYMFSTFGRSPHSSEFTMWIRCSTGRLCVDLTRPEFGAFFLFPHRPRRQAFKRLPPSAHVAASKGWVQAMIYSPTCVPDQKKSPYTAFLGSESLRPDKDLSGLIGFGRFFRHNYIFNRHGITSNYDDYVHVHAIQYQVTLTDTGRIPPGYLFLCPLRDFESEIPSHFRLPECPAYWSLDPSGAERLSTEEADELGFPRLECKMNVWVCSWDESVYNGLRKFHEGKGYDPYSQDVARDRGYSLYEVASELELFEETESCSGDESSDGLPSNEVGGESGKHFSLLEGTCCRFHDAELLEPSRTWKIVMAVQFILILASSVFCLMSYSPILPTSAYI
ncbi:hypothetical protein DFH09DRAFT_1310959 [Mycena vulgaris]|nr:hypothetical protein DFH09DRAFT_1310959 [Mycena vulgaris]